MNSDSHLDRKIVRLIDKVTKQKNESQNVGYSSLDITTGVAVLGGVRINFVEETLLDNKIALKMEILLKYQAMSRPKVM
jgi:hypothetical protein